MNRLRVPLVVGNENQITTAGYSDMVMFFRLALPKLSLGSASPAMATSSQHVAPLDVSIKKNDRLAETMIGIDPSDLSQGEQKNKVNKTLPPDS